MIKDRQGQVVRELEGQNQLLKKLYSTSIGRCALKILVSPFITHLGGFYMSSPLSKTSISSFIKNNSIDMRQYEEKNIKATMISLQEELKKEKDHLIKVILF